MAFGLCVALSDNFLSCVLYMGLGRVMLSFVSHSCLEERYWRFCGRAEYLCIRLLFDHVMHTKIGIIYLILLMHKFF